MEFQIQRKSRILYLYGFRTRGEILKKLVMKWPKSVLGKFDLDFTELYNFEKCIAYIEDYMI
ncbi:hypothetical protein RJ641_031466, partial [Dillenia turbinata]